MMSASRAPVASHPMTSETRFRRYRTVLGCTNNSRAVASSERPLSRLVTLTRVPKGKVRWAAVMAFSCTGVIQLTVDGERWRGHLRDVAGSTPGVRT